MKPAPLYISEAEAARLLGHDVSWLRSNASALERQYGFPRVDPAIGKRHRPSIEAWAQERNSRPTRIELNDKINLGKMDAF